MRQSRTIKLSVQAQSVSGNLQIATSSRDDEYNGILIWLRNFNERLKYDPIETLGKPFASHTTWRIERQTVSRCLVEVIFDIFNDSDTIHIIEINFSE